MRAMGIRSFGGAERLELLDVPTPQIGPQEVLIRVKTAGVGLWDIKVRENQSEIGDAELPFPVILGWESAGVVTQAGSQVTDLSVGDEVLAYGYQRHNYAEYVAVPASAAARKPPLLGFDEAAALPVNGNTAHQAIYDELKLKPTETVLITGGSGATGLLAVQLASQLGAHVITTTSKSNRDFVASLGADEVICYDETDFVSAIRQRYPDGIDAVLECVDGKNLLQSVKTLKPGGRLISLTEWDQSQPLPSGITARHIIGETGGVRLAKVAALAADGKLKAEIQKIFPLEQCADAHRILEQRHGRGKIVLRISE